MVSLPVGSMEVAMLAVLVPFTAGLSVAEPSVVEPFLKVTVPVGLGALLLTVAVRVTACPDTDGLGADMTTVLLLAWLTVCVSVPLLAW